MINHHVELQKSKDFWRRPLAITGVLVFAWAMIMTFVKGHSFTFLPQSLDSWQWFGLCLMAASEARSRK